MKIGKIVADYIGSIVIVGACMIILTIGSMKRKAEWLLNLILRSVLGTITIYFVNMALSTFGIKIGVGINWITILTSGILGFPGVAALYGISFYEML